MLHNISKIDQKSLSKRFMTSQQTFTCSKSTRKHSKSVRFNVFILTSEHYSYHFRVTIADFKQENIYLDSFFWLWNYIYIDFFKTIKRCCRVHVQAKLLFKGSLIQIWKSPYMFVFIWKQYSENFSFVILRIMCLFTCEVCKFLKK